MANSSVEDEKNGAKPETRKSLTKPPTKTRAKKPTSSTTTPKSHSGRFVKGDPRINRKGRPRSFNTLRELAKKVAGEEVEVKVDGVDTPMKMTRAEVMLRQWAVSSQFQLQKAFIELAYGKTPDAPAEDETELKSAFPTMPVDLISPSFFNVYRDIKNSAHTEYVFYGGRGSTKSSFTSLMVVWLIVNNPLLHAMVTRQVGNTLRDSVFSQLAWAINEMGLSEKFKQTTTPMEFEYLPTHQKIYFRGADDPNKLKSIKPKFGYIGILWLEELDQYSGAEAVRKIEQSVIRGGDKAYIFKTFNPPITASNWANQYVLIPKETQLQHKSSYLDVPREWLGEPWLDEAEHLKKVNPKAYDHEYLGNPNFDGGMVFGNVKLRKITNDEIATFDNVLNGLDWGYYPDPAHFVKVYYDAARLRLFIFGEVRKFKTSNEQLYAAIKKDGGYENWELLIADSAEPKSVADFRSYGATARGAEKGKESLRYSMKWLQSLNEIIIDPVRAPYSAKEFIEYEYERTKDDEIISSFPDKNNHAIDATRYATNHIWKRRGR